MAKKILVLIALKVFLLFGFGCSKKSEPHFDIQITKAEWSTSITQYNSSTFGFVNLAIAGSANCSKVTVQTYGDGDISDVDLSLDQNKSFNTTIGVYFTHQADNVSRKYSTIVTCFADNQSVKSVNLESGYLQYLKN